ncbi:MAG TPA: hypothetical protein VFE37_30985 [Chloroflexota bacterium]|nr:hypothetical protein [Chloroflexota bacterium]
MPTTPSDSALADRRTFVVVVRLVLDQRDRLVYGEVVDLGARVQGRFQTWRRLAPELRVVLAKLKQDGT